MKFRKEFAGLDGFYWWFGVVEDRQDPLGLGRCRVRIFGVHSESLSDIPTEDLPWAHPSHSVNNHTFSTPKEGEYVFGFFIDGKYAQQPVVMGIVPGFANNPQNKSVGFNDTRDPQVIRKAPKKPVELSYKTDGSGIKITEANTANTEVLETLRYPTDEQYGRQTITGVSRYSDLDKTAIKARKENRDKNVVTADGQTWDEPYTAYNPQYPYNQVLETESGHVFELDDTPRNERVALSHRSGTFFEVFPSGTKVEKITKQNYKIVMSDDHVHIMGKALITVDSDCLIKVLGDAKIEAGNDLDVKVSGTMNLSVKEALNIKAESLNIDISGETNMSSGSPVNITSDGAISLKGSKVNAQGASLDVKGNLNVSGSTDLIATGSDSNGDNHALPISGRGAGGATTATKAGIDDPDDRATKNSGVPTPEIVPVPLTNPTGTPEFDADTGTSYKQNTLVVTNPNDPDGPKIEDTANTANLDCTFNTTGKVFLSKDKWSVGTKGLALIKSSEGYADVNGKYGATPPYPGSGSVKAYPDPATKGEPITIGYGTTGPAVDQKITYDTTITQDQADEYLKYSINKKFLPTLKRCITVDLTQEMVDACLSLMYNIGGGNFQKSSVASNINEQNWCAAGGSFLKWNKAAGKELSGLTKRRKAERGLFLS
jgi:lysozyme